MVAIGRLLAMRTVEITAGGETHTFEVQTIKELTDALLAYAVPHTADKRKFWEAFGFIAHRYSDVPPLWEEPGLVIRVTDA